MKYKLIGAIAVAAALAAAVLVPALMPDESDRVHQHLVYQEKAACTREHAAEELCTHLPLVVIDTEGVEIPGKPLSHYTNEDGRVETKYTMAADGDTRISASMKIIDNEDGYKKWGTQYLSCLSGHADQTPSNAGGDLGIWGFYGTGNGSD